MLALRKSFDALTEGRAEYGHPGKGCHGPYSILTLVINRETQTEN